MNPLKPIASAALLAFSLSALAGEKPYDFREALTGAQFVTFTQAQKDWWIYGAFDALGHQIGMSKSKQGGCVLAWIQKDITARKTELEQYFAKYPSKPVIGIIIVLMENKCGINGR